VKQLLTIFLGLVLTAVADQVDPVIAAIDKGVDFLVETQNKDGSWGTHHSLRAYNVYAPIPSAYLSFKTGTTALATRGLLLSAPGREDARKAAEKGVDWLIKTIPKVKRDSSDTLYCNWGYIFGIDALVTFESQATGWKRQRVRGAIRTAIERLEQYSSIRGGWAYYDFDYNMAKPVGNPASFMTAAAILSLTRARAIGMKVSDRLIDRAITELSRSRLSDSAFLYNHQWRWAPRARGSRLPSSLGRTQSCLYALRMARGPESVSEAEIRRALEKFLTRNGWLGIGRKRPIPHESWWSVAGYYYCFGHAYASRLIGQLPIEEQADLRRRQAEILLAAQEPDGCWWDFPLYGYGKAYGTGFILQALAPMR
jgi:hypothetical protein